MTVPHYDRVAARGRRLTDVVRRMRSSAGERRRNRPTPRGCTATWRRPAVATEPTLARSGAHGTSACWSAYEPDGNEKRGRSHRDRGWSTRPWGEVAAR